MSSDLCFTGKKGTYITRKDTNSNTTVNILSLMRENLSSGFANNTGADQPVHPRSLISAFVIRLLESIIC